ncbi:MAG: T9SS type A sorting domain-containing protein, partial [Chitinophagales bacterium]
GLYPAAGDSDDWAYGDISTKPKTLAMTPEVGGDEDDFWPPIGNILSICEENVHQNFGSALLLLDNVETKDLSPAVFADVSGTIPFEITRLGLQDVNYVVSVEAIGDDFANIGTAATFTGLQFGDTDNDAITYTLSPTNIEDGTFQFVLITTTPNYTYRDTVTKYFGETEIEYTDNGGDMVVWQTSGDWGADNDAYSAPTSTSDSPNGNYGSNENNQLVSQTINLTNATAAFLNFYAKWDIEAGYDYAQVSASIVGQNNWEALCGNYTKVGNGNQDEGEPLYDGTQNNWIQESMSLNDFLGENIQIRYTLASDGFVDGDGFKFDDMEVIKSIEGEEDTTTNPIDTTTSIKDINSLIFLANIFPNPTNDMAYLSYDMSQLDTDAILVVYNQFGQKMQSQSILKPQGILEIDTRSFATGTYLYQVQSAKGNSSVGKLVVY